MDANEEYHRLSAREVASILHTIASILLPQVRAAQADFHSWGTIVNRLRNSEDDDTRMALHQLNRLAQAGRLDDDEPRRLAGLSHDEAGLLYGLI